jgi:HK97 family phage prohead protease
MIYPVPSTLRLKERGFETSELDATEIHMRALRTETREADFVASTEAVDSWGEIVEQKWILDRFKQNPVILYGHASRELPIGIATRCDVVKQSDGRDALECTVRFATAAMNPLAEQVWQMVQAKMLRAVSVGFNPRTARYEKRGGEEVMVLSDNELHEISVVAIPANPEALAKQRAKARQAGASAPGAANVKEKTTMDLEEMKRALAEEKATRAAEKNIAEKAIADERKALADERVKSAALETQNKSLVAERDALQARCNAAEDKALDVEINALVGKKLTAAEAPTMKELAKTHRKLFDDLIAQKADLNLTKPIIGGDPAPANKAAAGADEADEAGDIEFVKSLGESA